MPLTREFRQTIQARAQRDARYRVAMLTEAVGSFLAGEMEVGKAILRDYVNATIGFESLAVALNKNSKSLQRMLGPHGNPTAENIFGILRVLQERESVHLSVKSSRDAA